MIKFSHSLIDLSVSHRAGRMPLPELSFWCQVINMVRNRRVYRSYDLFVMISKLRSPVPYTVRPRSPQPRNLRISPQLPLDIITRRPKDNAQSPPQPPASQHAPATPPAFP